MRRAAIVILAVFGAIGGGVGFWWVTHRPPPPNEITLYGNIDLREIDLAFNNNERIAEVLVEEGDHVHSGQILARVETSRLIPQVAQASALVRVDQANVVNARRQFRRLSMLWSSSKGRAMSRQDLDNAESAMDANSARVQADRAQLALFQEELKDAQLAAPTDATVRSRIMEPGDMASPSRSVLTLAVTNPKWVRVFVSEPDLGKLHPGMQASVTVDGFPGRNFPGWIGFISSVAEFTPKNIETEELRTSLVYEARIFVHDPGDSLRLGMPATVHIPLSNIGTSP